MSTREPTRDELLAMAYVDGELSGEDRASFEARLGSEPALLREVAELSRLGVMARQITPAEPKDFEWQRLEAETLHGGGKSLGLLASALGVVGLIGWGLYRLLTGDLELLPKVFVALFLLGLLFVFLLIFRARLRTLPHDPYTEVQR